MENKKKRPYLKLLLTFMKIGAFTFGGGYAMIPLIQREAAEKNKWVSEKDILDIVAVAESTPGPIAINAATFIGYQTAGFFGAFCATLGVVIPSFVIIYLISLFLREFSEIRAVKYAFFGIRAGVLSLIIKALLKMGKQIPKTMFSYIIAAMAFLTVVIFDVNVLYVIIACAIIGLCYSLTAGKEKSK